MSLKDKTIVVTGGSRGLGLGLVEALVEQGAKVTVVARNQASLAAVKQRLGVAVVQADVTDQEAAQRILADVRPDVLVLNAGATPRMGRFDQLSWADFTATWGPLPSNRCIGRASQHRPYLHTHCVWGASDTALGFLAKLWLADSVPTIGGSAFEVPFLKRAINSREGPLSSTESQLLDSADFAPKNEKWSIPIR